MDCNSFEALQVTAYFRSGIVSDQWLPLDAILFAQACREELGPQLATLPGGDDPDVSLPLAVIHSDTPYWYYACSWAQPQPWWTAEGRDHWNKRFDSKFADLVDFSGKRGKVVIEQGRYKAYHMPLFYYVADKVEWYCVGDRTRIADLLSTVTHAGKKRVQGWGRIIRWEIESWPEDWSVWRDGKLTRGVPAEDVAGQGAFDFIHYGLRPSYYRAENQVLLARPK
jgi:hypothetical protein